MATHKHLNEIIVCCLLVVALYLVWTAVGSTSCVTNGIVDQTRTSWAATTGCVKAPEPIYPWTTRENR